MSNSSSSSVTSATASSSVDASVPPHLPSISWSELTPDIGGGDSAPSIGHGSMGLVLRCQWRGRAVAVKLMFATSVAGSPERALQALEREARALYEACGSSDFVIPFLGLVQGKATSAIESAIGSLIYSVLFRGELVGFVMEWAERGNLATQLYHGAWSAKVPEKLLLCARIAEGVAGLHENEPNAIIHGDIKCENVLLKGREGALVPLLADFGLADLREAAELAAASSSLRYASSSSSEAAGTFAYKAPEMLHSVSGGPKYTASRKTDVYALGTLVWEVLTEQKPWAGVSEFDRALASSQGRGLLCLDKPPLPYDTPLGVVDLLRSCLSAAREERPPAGHVAACLLQHAIALSDPHFDIFLSHAWSPETGKHETLTTEVYCCLTAAGWKVWLDTNEMSHNTSESMKSGIDNSTCVVVLLSERYLGRPNCLLELQHAQDRRKPIVVAFAEGSVPNWFPTHPLFDKKMLAADLNAAAAVDWSCEEDRSILMAPNALRKVKQLVLPYLKEDTAIATGGGGGASPTTSPSLTGSLSP